MCPEVTLQSSLEVVSVINFDSKCVQKEIKKLQVTRVVMSDDDLRGLGGLHILNTYYSLLKTTPETVKFTLKAHCQVCQTIQKTSFYF